MTMCCPTFIKSEDLDPEQRDCGGQAAPLETGGPLGVWVRSAVIPASRDFVTAAGASALRTETTTGRDRGGPAGWPHCSKHKPARECDPVTYMPFLKERSKHVQNLTIITHAHVTKDTLSDGADDLSAKGSNIATQTARARDPCKTLEVILSAGCCRFAGRS